VIVVDASVVFAAIFEDHAGGRRCAERLAAAEHICAPQLMPIEVLAAARKQLQRGGTSPSTVSAALPRLIQIAQLVDHTHLLPRAWELRANVTPYDALYVALAEAIDAVLVTGDREMATASGPRCERELIEA
jgi:predicted nucleic acid-binding protein